MATYSLDLELQHWSESAASVWMAPHSAENSSRPLHSPYVALKQSDHSGTRQGHPSANGHPRGRTGMGPEALDGSLDGAEPTTVAIFPLFSVIASI